MVVVLMGVSGAGKTTVGRLLAARLGWPFLDADDLHPPANVAKMAAGRPLDDADRVPWLDALRSRIARWDAAGTDAVLACSALRRSHRQRMVPSGADVRFALLLGDLDLIRDRLGRRRGHFMPASLLASQAALLEPPDDAIALDVADPPERIVDRIVETLL